MELLRSKSGKILVEAHRGAEAIAPPNSWASILAGAEAGADLIGLDIQLAGDEVPIVYEGYRLPGGDLVRAIPSAAMAGMDVGDGKAPPILAEVLAWLAGQALTLALEVKSGFGMGVLPFMRVLEAIEQAGVVEKLLLTSLDHMGLLWAKRHMPALRTRALLRGNPIDLVAVARRAEVDAISLSYDLIDHSDVEALHEVGIAVFLAELWEPNFRYPVSLGVDGLIWGDPTEAIFALEAQGAR